MKNVTTKINIPRRIDWYDKCKENDKRRKIRRQFDIVYNQILIFSHAIYNL